MSLAAGTRLGPYEILAPLGEGGMGQVYLGTDTRLNRTVAVKVLRGGVSEDSDARRRFQREGEAIAALNHPHICTLHDVGSFEGCDYLVMEHVQGETLAARIARGALPVAEAVARAIEIADALDEAHRASIVHRDLKPSNVIVSKSGAKLLDFGIALLRPAASPLSAQATTAQGAPATSGPAGTLPYMAPEQVEGKPVDCRTDIFAFGAVLFEMLTGTRAFAGSGQALAAAVLRDQPPPVSRLAAVSPAIDHVVARCLAKDPADRWQTARDLAGELTWISRIGIASAFPSVAPDAARNAVRSLPFLAGALIVALVAGVWWFAGSEGRQAAPSPVQAVRTNVVSEALIGGDGLPAIAVSPDGRHLAYAGARDGVTRLYLRRLDRLDAAPIPGSERASAPFFSRDGASIAFFADEKLKRVYLDGRAPAIVCDAPGARGGTWDDSGGIIFSRRGELVGVPAAGGVARVVAAPGEPNISYRWPDFVPHADAVIYTTGKPADTIYTQPRVVMRSLRTGAEQTLVTNAVFGRYAASGHLMFLRDGAVYAVPLDAVRMEVTGEPRLVADDVVISRRGAAAQYAIAADGSFVYLPAEGIRDKVALVWVDRQGQVTKAAPLLREFTTVRIAPDRQRAALHVASEKSDIWTLDLERGSFGRLTFGAEFEGEPVWTHDSARVAFAADRASGLQIFWKAVHESTGEEPIFAGQYPRIPQAWSPDGKRLAFTEYHPRTGQDIWVGSVEGDHSARPFVATAFDESQPEISADGRWLAYQSNESGKSEVYVRPFPEGPGRVQISTEGGAIPRWSRLGKELFFRLRSQVFAVDLEVRGSALRAGRPRLLFDGDYFSSYDVAADGSRFLMLQPQRGQYPRNLVFVQGWTALLKD